MNAIALPLGPFGVLTGESLGSNPIYKDTELKLYQASTFQSKQNFEGVEKIVNPMERQRFSTQAIPQKEVVNSKPIS